MIQTDSPEGSSFDPADPVSIQNQHQPLISAVSALSTAPASAGYCFYSTPIRKSKGTSYCSMNSKSFYCSQQSCRVTVAFGGNSFHLSKSKLLSVIPAISSSIQRLPPAYLMKPSPQSLAGLKLLPQPTEVSLPLQQRFSQPKYLRGPAKF